MPINIQGVKDIQQKFYSSLVETSNSLALSQLWLIKVDRSSLVNIGNASKLYLNQYEGFTKQWDIFNNTSDTIRTSWFVGNTFYMLAQSAVFPGDSISVSRSGLEQTGMLKGIVCDSRSDLSDVTITFLETNQSVADLFFRPWMLLIAHKSLKDQTYRTDIELVCFQKGNILEDLRTRKSIKLIAAAPTIIDNEEYNYTADKVIERQITFTYNTYNITADTIIDNQLFKGNDDYIAVAEAKMNVAYIENSLPKKDIVIRWDTQLDIKKVFKTNKPDLPKKDVVKISFRSTLDKKKMFLIEEIRKTLTSQGTPVKKNLLDSLRSALQTANQVFNDIKGKADKMRGELTSALRLAGQTNLANKVDKGYNVFTKTVQTPIGNVIGTGNRINQATFSAQSLAKSLTTSPFKTNAIQTMAPKVNIIPGPGSI